MSVPLLARYTASRPARRLAGMLLLVLVLSGCASTGGAAHFQFDWNAFTAQIFSPDQQIINGLWLTISISVISQVIGVVLGLFGALGRLSKLWPVRLIANFYIWVFRGTPLLVQLVFFYFGFSVAHIYGWPPITVFGLTIDGAIQAGVFTLGVNEGAYMSEIIRAGIISIDPGQMEAAKSLGMTYSLGMRRVVLPQAARVIVPPLGNEFNNMLKTTSLLFVLGVIELYNTFVIKQGLNFEPFEMYLACALWFLLLTTIWSFVQAWIERRLGRGTSQGSGTRPSLRERWFGNRSESTDEPIRVSGGR